MVLALPNRQRFSMKATLLPKPVPETLGRHSLVFPKPLYKVTGGGKACFHCDIGHRFVCLGQQHSRLFEARQQQILGEAPSKVTGEKTGESCVRHVYMKGGIGHANVLVKVSTITK